MVKFSIYLKNHPSGSLVTLGDILQPLAAGLAETGELGHLFSYAPARPYDELVDACDLLLRGDPVAFGVDAQRRFRLEAPMRGFLKEPLAVAGLPA